MISLCTYAHYVLIKKCHYNTNNISNSTLNIKKCNSVANERQEDLSSAHLGHLLHTVLMLRWFFSLPSGTKRKSERSDNQDLKRLRPSSGHGSSRPCSTNKRGPGLAPSLSSSKKPAASSPRGRHATASSGYRHDYYEERKARRGVREAPRSHGGEDTRRRDSHRVLDGPSQVLTLNT